MGQVKFGTKQLNNPTPHNVSMLFDFMAGALGIIGGFVTTAAFISHDVSDVISSVISALLIPLLLLAKRFFGVTTPPEDVPVDQVSEMETKPKDP